MNPARPPQPSRAGQARTRSVAPERDAPPDAGLVRHDRRVGAGRQAHFPRISPADVQMIEVHERAQVLDGTEKALVPLPVAGPPPGFVAELLLVGLALPEGVMGELEMRRQA